MLKNGADVNIVVNRERTPLVEAVIYMSKSEYSALKIHPGL